MVVRDKVDREYGALNPKPPLRLRSQRDIKVRKSLYALRNGERKGKLEK